MSETMKEVYTYQDVVLYSDKELDRVDGSHVWFKDGSEANLEDLSIKSVGTGLIKFDVLDREPSESDEHRTEVIRFEHGEHIDLNGCDLYFEIRETTGEHCWLELIGSEWFHSTTRIEPTENGIFIETERRRRRWNSTEYIEGRMILRVPANPTPNISNNGSGFGRVHLPLSDLDMKINGSLNLKCGSANIVNIKINGSGQVGIGQIKDSCTLRINGSGDIKVDEGAFNNLDAKIGGSGRIRINATVQDADLRVSGSGSIKVHRVTEQLIKKSRHSSSISVQHIGQPKAQVE